MILLRNVTKWYPTRHGKKYVFVNASLYIPSGKSVGIIGHNGAGKTTLVNMLGGVESPNEGQIHITGSISWPVGLKGGFQAELSGRDNVRFLCRVTGLSRQEIRGIEENVLNFSELGGNFDLPVRSYSSGMKARLGFGLSMSFDFDYYLIDEMMSVGDRNFRSKSKEVFAQKVKKSNLIIVSHSPKKLKQNCEVGVVIADKKFIYFDDILDALEFYNRQQDGQRDYIKALSRQKGRLAGRHGLAAL